MKVVHERKAATPPSVRPGGFRLVVGFLIAMAGGFCVAYQPGAFRVLLRRVLPHLYQAMDAGIAAAFQTIPNSAIQRAREWVEANGDYAQWTPQVVGALCLLLAGWCLKKRVALFIAASGAFGITIGALSAAYDWYMPVQCIVLPAVGLGYLVQSARNPAGITPKGVLGFGFVCLAIIGLVVGYFFLPLWGPAHAEISETVASRGPGYLWAVPVTGGSVWFLSASFVEQWSDVALWGAVLLLSAIGAVLCRDRLLRFLAACLISAIAVVLFKSAFIEWVFFPSLGENVAPLQSDGLNNIKMWQWLALAELVIVSAVLLYKSLGAGGLTVAVALLWICCGLHVDKSAGQLNMTRYFTAQFMNQMNEAPSESAFGGNMGMPNGRLPAKSVKLRKASSQDQLLQETTKQVVGAAVPAVWVYFTAALAGLMLAAGLRMMVGNSHARWWLTAALWVIFGLILTCIIMRWPSAKTTTITGWLGALTTHPIHREVIQLVTAASSAFFGMWSLRWNSRYQTWLLAAATAVFVGTLLSFVALAVMIRWGGFGALPVQSYIVLAVGQSALMWVLLLHSNFARPEPAHAA